jgi:hypothetical protein
MKVPGAPRSIAASPPPVTQPARSSSSATAPAQIQNEVAPKPSAGQQPLVNRLGALFMSHWRRIPTSLTLWLALPLFFLPWINVTCNGRDYISQSGMQTATGGYSVAKDLEGMTSSKSTTSRSSASASRGSGSAKDEDELKGSFLSWVYLLAVVVGSLLGLACAGAVVAFQLAGSKLSSGRMGNMLSWGITGGHFVVLLLGCLCFVALFGQMLFGFPVDREIDKANKEMRDSAGSKGSGVLDGSALAGAMELKSSYTFWLWLSFLITFGSLAFLLFEAAVTAYSILARAGKLPPSLRFAALTSSP